MDVDTLRTIILVISFAAFVGIVLWAWSGRRRARFEEAAELPFADEAMQRRTLAAQAQAETEKDTGTETETGRERSDAARENGNDG